VPFTGELHHFTYFLRFLAIVNMPGSGEVSQLCGPDRLLQQPYAGLLELVGEG
jgi:hypothetical protein